MSAQVKAFLRCNSLNIFSFELTDGSTLKAFNQARELLKFVSSCIAIFVLSFFTRLTVEPFAEKPIDNLPLFHFVRTELEATRFVSGGLSHKFNAIRHGRETAEIGLSPETAEIVCNAPRLISGQPSLLPQT